MPRRTSPSTDAVFALIRLWHRLRALVTRRGLERDLEEEIGFHLAMREADYRAGGLTAEDARAAARRRFGNVTLITEDTRENWMFAALESLRQDVRYAVRLLRRAPAFSVVSIVVLAVGIGGNTAIFSLVDAVRLRALPYKDADGLVVLWGNVQRANVERRGASYPDFLDWRAQAGGFEGMAAFGDTRMTMSGAGEAVRIPAETVSASYFQLLGVNAALGRTFLPEEDLVAQKIPVVVLSDGVWRRTFGADPSIVGRAIRLDGRAYTVVGVMPPGFRGLTDNGSLWIPYVMSDTAAGLAERGDRGFEVLARLKPGVSLEAAQTETNAIAHRLEQAYPATNEKRGIEIAPLDAELLGGFRPALRLLMVAVALVLLIGCANVANLQLARAEARQREMAVRTAIGAGWARLLRQLVTESVVLTAIAAAIGLLLANWGITGLLRRSPIAFPSFVQPHVSARVAAFTIAVSSLCAIVMGLAPTVNGRVARLADALKNSARGSTGVSARRTRAALVIAEVALAVVLVAGAGLMIRSVQRLVAIDPGFDPHGVLTARVSIPRVAAPTAT
ncbi:MAG TPA: ABC transporter permease, partial [Vicinamibacterales bacterium]|nr:ABC transporter permease [Vicinamibacterales bacterium]